MDQVPDLASLPFSYQFDLFEGEATTPSFGWREPEGVGGTTTHTVAQGLLSDGADYRWRVAAEYGGFLCRSDVARFRTPLPTIAAPSPVSPANGAADLSSPVELRVANGATFGNAGAISMHFEVAPNRTFEDEYLLDVAPVPAGDRYTSVSLPASLVDVGTAYYWRAIARGTRGVESPYSDVWSFTTADTPGSEVDPLEVQWLHTNVSSWSQTSTITDVRINDVPAGGVCIEHTQANSWPGVDGKLGTVVAGNAWVFAEIEGVWYGATYEWLRPGQICKLTVGGKHNRPSIELGPHTKQSPLREWVPRSGEQVGFMVSTLARFGPEGPRRERSNIVLVTWP